MTLHLASGLERLAERAAEATDDLPVDNMRNRARRRRAVRTAATSAAGIGTAGVLAAAVFTLPPTAPQVPGYTAGQNSPSPLDEVPSVRVQGSRPVEYTSITQLAGDASAIIVARATGNTSERPLPPERGGTASSPALTIIEMKVERVLSGTVESKVIEVVSPGDDEQTGKPVLALNRPFILFITPALWRTNEPAGGYVAVGGPAGVYAGSGASFAKVDTLSPRMPDELSVDSTAWPTIILTEEDLVRRGPR